MIHLEQVNMPGIILLYQVYYTCHVLNISKIGILMKSRLNDGKLIFESLGINYN